MSNFSASAIMKPKIGVSVLVEIMEENEKIIWCYASGTDCHSSV
jgi:hypothetical protein